MTYTLDLVSVLTVTLNRFELAKQCLGPALEKAGWTYELLCVDNGSTDHRVIEYIDSFEPIYHQLNPRNEGYAVALNQMLLRAKGEFLCVLDPDLVMPDRWLEILVKTNKAVPNSGLSSYYCVEDSYPEQCINGCNICPGPKVFGVKFFNRKILNEVGYFDELALYGCEDNAYNYRLHKAGYMNYYIGGGLSCVHAGDDSSFQTEYRHMKWNELRVAMVKLGERIKEIDSKLDFIERERKLVFYTPPPAIRWIEPEEEQPKKSFLERLFR